MPFFLGLVLIVLGTGLLKPNISAIVGDLYPEGGARRDAGFSIFYMGINLGAFVGQLVTGFLGEQVGWHWGFGAAGVGMLIGLIVVRACAPAARSATIGARAVAAPGPGGAGAQERTVEAGARRRPRRARARRRARGDRRRSRSTRRSIGQNMTYVLVGAGRRSTSRYLFVAGGLDGDEKKRVAVILVLFVFAAIFWSAFEQAPTSLNLFARDFTDRTARRLRGAGDVVPVGQLGLHHPARAGVRRALGGAGASAAATSRARRSSRSGSSFAGLGFLLMIFAANIVVGERRRGEGLAVVAGRELLLPDVGELCLSPVGLSSMTKLSPRRYVGQMMGIWFLATAVGNLIAGLVGGHVDPEKLEQMPKLFTTTTVSLVGAGVVLALLIVPIRRMMASRAKRGGHQPSAISHPAAMRASALAELPQPMADG